MKAEEKSVIYWAVASLIMFLLVTWLMTLKWMQLSRPVVMQETIQTTEIAVVFYAATLILALLKVRISYYLLAVVVALYTVGLVGMLMTALTGSHAFVLLRLVMAALSIFGLIVNFYWYILAFRLRSVLQREAMEKKIKNKQLKR